MQVACRAPQLVMQTEIEGRLGILLQLAIQTFCSPLHFIGWASAAGEQSSHSPATAAAAHAIL
jgi:hypothetical protein